MDGCIMHRKHRAHTGGGDENGKWLDQLARITLQSDKIYSL